MDMKNNKKLFVACVFCNLLFTTLNFVFLFGINSFEGGGGVDITNTTCVQSEYIGRRLFFHTCLKDGKTVYDLRYFWKDSNENNKFKASIIGIQATTEEFKKICTFCHVKE